MSQVARTDHISTTAPQATFVQMSARSGKSTIEEIAEEEVMQGMGQNTMLAALVLMSLGVSLAGCGAGSQASSPPPASSNPTVVLFSLSPVSVTVGGNGFTLTVSGSNFASSTIVRWNGESVPNTFVSSQQVTAKISPSLIASAGFASVTAQNANSSVSNALEFRVNNPAPQIASISPGSAMAGAAPLFLAVSGSGFVSGATLLLNGSPRPTTPQTDTQLLTTLSASDLAATQSVTVAVANPEPSAGPSNQIAFTITPLTSNAIPTLVSASDASVPAGWPGFQLTVNGTNFVGASVLQWNGTNRLTTVTSSTELKAAIPASLLASPGAAQISVVNPSPGGGVSSPLHIQVQVVPPDAIGVIERSDIGDDFSEPNGNSESAAVSGDGRFVVFRSSASTLVPNTHDINGELNLFLRDTCIGVPTGCVPSVTLLPPAHYKPAISANGRFVAFSSDLTAFLYDTCVGAPVSCNPTARLIDSPPNGEVGQISLSGDGRFAVFLSGQFTCSPWDYGCSPSQGSQGQVYLANTCAGVSSACTPSSRAIAPPNDAFIHTPTGDVFLHPSITPDGRFVIFNTSDHDVSLFDSCQGAPATCSPSTTIVSVASDGSPADAYSFGGTSSAGGRFVAFLSSATNLVPGTPRPGVLRVYLRDMCTGAPSGCAPATTSISVAGSGTPFADAPSISADGRYIAFASGTTDLVPLDTNGAQDVFVRDTCIGAVSGCSPSTVRVSVALDGTQGSKDSFKPVISADGRFLIFISAAKLGPGSPNSLGGDVYLARY